jgi:hypothetical protein
MAIVGGCGEEKGGTELVPASATGKILLPDGSPMSGGKIIFAPDEDGFPKVDTTIKGDGTFAIEKALPGLYNIAIDSGGSASSMPVKYKSISTSGLTATLKAGPNDLTPFKLDNLPPASPIKGASSVRD